MPPMEFALLRALLPAALEVEVAGLLAAKASATEKTTVPRPAALAAFLAEEYATGQAAREQLPVRRGPGVADELDALFRELIGR